VSSPPADARERSACDGERRAFGSGRSDRGNERGSADRAVELLGGRMVGAVKDYLEDGAALGGDRQAALAVGGEEAVHPLFLVGRAHGSGMIISTRW